MKNNDREVPNNDPQTGGITISRDKSILKLNLDSVAIDIDIVSKLDVAEQESGGTFRYCNRGTRNIPEPIPIAPDMNPEKNATIVFNKIMCIPSSKNFLILLSFFSFTWLSSSLSESVVSSYSFDNLNDILNLIEKYTPIVQSKTNIGIGVKESSNLTAI